MTSAARLRELARLREAATPGTERGWLLLAGIWLGFLVAGILTWLGLWPGGIPNP